MLVSGCQPSKLLPAPGPEVPAHPPTTKETPTPTPAQVPAPPPSPSPKPVLTTITEDQAFIRLTDYVQKQARTQKAKEYVTLFFPPYHRQCTRDEELKAWIITLTSFNSEYYAIIKNVTWFKGDASQYYSSLSGPVWLVYDDGIILPLYSAQLIEADIERLNASQTIIPSSLKPAPIAIPESRGGPASLPVSEQVILAAYSRDSFYNPRYSSNTQGCVHASVAFVLAEGDTIKLVLESDIPIDWDSKYLDSPNTKIGVLFAEMRSFTEKSGWISISSYAKEVKNVFSSNEGRQLEILLSPTDIVGGGENYPRKGIYKLLAINLDLKRPHSLKYSVDPVRLPTPAPAPVPAPTPASSSDITDNPSTYDEKTVELSGQTYLSGSPPKLLVDGKSGVNITGNTATLEKGFYRLKGVYDADTNTLNVTGSTKEDVKYLAIEEGKKLGVKLVPVAVQGLIATTPKEVANALTSYLSISNFPKDVPIYPYVVYTKDALYLALSDALLQLPAKFTFLYQGKDYSFTFCAGEVKGTLVKTPMEKINFGPKWEFQEFGGVIIANSIAPLEPIEATVKEININPPNYTFRRVAIDASYIVTTATVDYSEIKAPMGQGILADQFADFFKEDTKLRLETIDPNRKVWQLRRGKVIGTVMYPTEQILRYFDYSAPLTKSEIKERLKPALIVDTLVDEVVKVANISELNPVVGKPSNYWGKVVEFDGYALGINYPLKKVAEAIVKTEVPVNVNLLAIGIADKPDIGSQLAIIGLNNELIDRNGEVIKGRFKFSVAVTRIPEELVSGVPYADTAFFLLSKEELPIEVPTAKLYSLNVTVNPSGAGSVIPPGASPPRLTLQAQVR